MTPGDADGASSSAAAKKNSRRPKYSRFTQQELPACKPVLTPCKVITSFISIGVIFIPIGLAALFASEKVVEIVVHYDEECIPSNYTKDMVGFIQNPETDKRCFRSLNVPKKMKQPIFVYYELDGFYQNHRRYVKSRVDKQLRDKAFEDMKEITKYCAPEDKTNDGKPIVPCGLIAWSLFNDTYAFTKNNNPIRVNKKGIAWESDRKHKFGSDVYPKNFQQGNVIGGAKLNESIPLSEQEDLMVWMRTAAFPNFRKLYGKIEEDLEVNHNITVEIGNNYNTYGFKGKKKLVLSTTTWMGGKNEFLGIAYLTVGGLCLFIAIGFILLYVFRPRALGDTSYLSWNKNPAGSL